MWTSPKIRNLSHTKMHKGTWVLIEHFSSECTLGWECTKLSVTFMEEHSLLMSVFLWVADISKLELIDWRMACHWCLYVLCVLVQLIWSVSVIRLWAGMSPNSLTTRVYLPHRLSEGLLVGPLSRFNGTPTAQEDSHTRVSGKDFSLTRTCMNTLQVLPATLG